MWTLRGRSELATAGRAWFGTLTINPDHRLVMRERARVRLRSGGTDMDGLSSDDAWSEIAREVGAEVTKYLKRIRKESKVRGIRQLVVTEEHEDGFPHIHAVLFEPLSQRGELKKKTLDSQWKLGFTHWRLLTTPAQIAYATKYVAKTRAGRTRVRASVRFGRCQPKTLSA